MAPDERQRSILDGPAQPLSSCQDFWKENAAENFLVGYRGKKRYFRILFDFTSTHGRQFQMPGGLGSCGLRGQSSKGC